MWAVVSSVSLVLVYQHLKVRWPQSYFEPAQGVAEYVSATGLRFLTFRLVPPFAVFVVVGMYASRPTTSLVASAVLYIVVSSLLSVRSSLLRSPGHVRLTRQRGQVLVLTAIGVGAAAAAAWAVAPHLRDSAPPVATIIASLIGSFITAVVVLSYVRATDASGTEAVHRGELAPEILVWIRSIALESSVEPRLAVALALSENAKRPPWFRRLERAASMVNRSGSFGLFQVRGHGPVSDLESCRIAMGQISGTFPLRDENGWPVEWSVRRCAEAHNPDEAFASMVWEKYCTLWDERLVATDELGPDARPLLDVVGVSRFGRRTLVRGTFWSATETVSVEVLTSAAAAPTTVEVDTFGSQGSRAGWSAELPDGTRLVVVRSTSPLAECQTSADLTVDLTCTPVERDLSLREEPPGRQESRTGPGSA